MRILVYPHDLGMGGSQLNAIELAAGVRDLGHEVTVFGRPGALNARIDDLGLDFVAAPPPGKRPSPTTARALAALVAERGIDVIHGYEWPPALDAVLAARMSPGVQVVSTVMSMSVPPFIPRSVPLVVGTEEIAAFERASGRARTVVIEPPVDLDFNDVGSDPGVDGFRTRFGLGDDRIVLVAVTRFARELKLEGILTAIDVVGWLSARFPLQLVLVGDGPARAEVEERARAVNERHGPGTVVLTGQLDDPRPAYAAADISFGMGGSALRALAYGSPLIVQGERGFWRALSPDSAGDFLWTGWYGVGDGDVPGDVALERELVPLLEDAELRRERGRYGLTLVRDRFSLTRAAHRQVEVYERALARCPRAAALAEAVALRRYGAYYLGKRVRRARGLEAADDFNAKPVAGRGKDGRSTGAPASEPLASKPSASEAPALESQGPAPLIWFAGVGWDETMGTDRRIVEEVAREREVVWVDPPHRRAWPGWWRGGSPAVQRTESITRIRVPATIGVTRWPTRAVSSLLQWQAGRRAHRIVPGAAVVVSHPLARLPRARGVTRVLYLTDDWIAGAPLMGFSERAVRRTLRSNARRADVIVVVSPPLLDLVRAEGAAPRAEIVLPNGAPPVDVLAEPGAREPVAGLIGQLNERLDLALLEAVVDAGIRLRIVGPDVVRDRQTKMRLAVLLSHPLVDWVGPVPPDELAGHWARIAVGLTPYLPTRFNLASSPLKTLEYLAAGLPVVSSDLPAAAWLGFDDVAIAPDAAAFVERAQAFLATRDDRARAQERMAFARRHGWDVRASQLLAAIDSARSAVSADADIRLTGRRFRGGRRR